MSTSPSSTRAHAAASACTARTIRSHAKPQTRRRGWAALAAGLLLALVLPGTAFAQLAQQVSVDTRGDIVMTGNALLVNCTDISPGNNSACANEGDTDSNVQMYFMDVDSVGGGAPANSSSATLSIPSDPGTDVLYAYLYWGARGSESDTNRENIWIKAPNGSYQQITADKINTYGGSYGGSAAARPYTARADVTALVDGAGSGSYSVGGLTAKLDDTDNLGDYGGWALIVVYHDPSKPFRRLMIFNGGTVALDGDLQDANGDDIPDSVSVTVAGLLTPASGTVNSYMGALVWEGDDSIEGDQFKLQNPSGSNADVLDEGPLSDSNSLVGDFWNSRITNLGVMNNARNPSFPNLLGMDLKLVDISHDLTGQPRLNYGADSVQLEFYTDGDTYFPQALVFVTDQHPGQSLVKACPSHTDSDANTAISFGDVLNCTITLTNTGNVAFPANTVTITDTLAGFVPSSKTCTASIPVDGTCVLSGTYTVQQSDVDAGQVVNNATAVSPVCDSGSNATFCSTTVTVPVPRNPSIQLTKSASPTSVTAAGSQVDYTFSVENTGNVTITSIDLSDTLLSGLSCTQIASLAPGASASFTCTGASYTVTQADIDNNGGGDGDIDNTATATGKDPGNSDVSDTDSASVSLPTPNPELSVIKSVESTGPYTLGDSISYKIVVTNSGNVTLTSVALNDSLSYTLSCSPIALPADMDPGDTTDCTGSYTVTSPDVTAGQVHNVATATGKDPNGNDVTGTDNKTVPTTQPTITVTKTANPTSGSTVTAGQAITYTLQVVVADVHTTSTLVLTDTLSAGLTFGSVTNAGGFTPDSSGAPTLTFTLPDHTVPGTYEVEYTATVDNDASGTVSNGVVSTGGGDPTPTCTMTSPCGTSHNVSDPSIDVSKASDPVTGSIVNADDLITYTVTATVSDAALTADLVLTDTLSNGLTFGSVTSAGSYSANTGAAPTLVFTLPSGTVPGTYALTYTATVDADATDRVSNVVVPTGGSDTPPTCTICSTTQTLDPPSVSLVKRLQSQSGGNNDAYAEPGETLVYTITLTNSGGSIETDYDVTDSLDPNVNYVSDDHGGTHSGADANGFGGKLDWTGLTVPANNGKLVLTVTVTVRDPIPDNVTRIDNLAYKAGTTPTCQDVPNQCPTIPTAPQVSIAKQLTGQTGTDDSEAEPGETLTYTITLTNTGGSQATNQQAIEIVPANTTYAVVTGSSAWLKAPPSTPCAVNDPAGTQCSIKVNVPASNGTTPGVTTLIFAVKVDDPLPSGVTTITNIVGLNNPPPPCTPANPQPWCVPTPTPPYVTMAKELTGESVIPADQIAEPGETLTYKITLTNSGGTDALDYRVTDQLDPFVTLVSASNSGALADADGQGFGGKVNWPGVTVPKAGGQVVYTVKVKVSDPIPQGVRIVANLVYQTGSFVPPCPPDIGPQCVIIPTAANIAVAKALTGESIKVDNKAELGEELTYTITVRNWGGTQADDVIVNEKVPGFTTFVSGAPQGTLWSCVAGAAAGAACSTMVDVPAATKPGATVQPGMATVTFTVKVADFLPPGITQLENIVGFNDVPPPPCTDGDPACVTTPTVNMSLTKSVVSVVDTGSGTYEVNYRIEVANIGGTSEKYTLDDTTHFPDPGVTFINNPKAGLVTTTDGLVNPALAGGQFTVTNGTQVQLSATDVIIGSGTTDTYLVTYKVGVNGDLTAGSCTGQPDHGFFNSADLYGTYDLHSDTCAPVSASQARLGLVKTVELLVDNNGDATGDVDDVLSYTFTLTNTGTMTLSTLQLFDARASGLTCKSQTTSGFPLHVTLVGDIFFDGFDGGLGILRINDSIICTATYVLTQADVTRGFVKNTANAGASSKGNAVSAIGTATFRAF